LKVIGFDNRFYNLELKNKDINGSAGHAFAKILLKKLFPNDNIYEEVTLRGSKKALKDHDLRSDFIIPAHKIIIEVHGEQHYKYVPHYHNDKKDFIESIKRDNRKKEWCQLNNIKYIELQTGKEDEWERRIIDSI
jgi:hypothetical protein